jgi:F-type H+-transporting ATPase subunit b
MAAFWVTSASALSWAAEGDAHESAEHAASSASHEQGAHHAPSFEDINWYYGLLFEREGAEPSLLFRPKGMPVPFLGYVFNALVFYAILYRFAKQPVQEGLARRKASIERGMKEAAEHKAQARARLEEYERKLESIEEEIERVRRDMRQAGEGERARILSEARARRERMERDARLLVEQEFAAAREILTREAVEVALRSARNTLKARVTAEDHGKLAELYLSRLPKVAGLSRAAKGAS